MTAGPFVLSILMNPQARKPGAEEWMCSIHLRVSPAREDAPTEDRAPVPPLILTVGWSLIRSLCETLLEDDFVLRLDIRDPPDAAWLWPKVYQSIEDLELRMKDIVGTYPNADHSKFYPLFIWAVPHEYEYEAARAIDEFMEDGGDKALARRALDFGAIRLSFSETGCTISAACKVTTTLQPMIKDASAHSPIPVVWI